MNPHLFLTGFALLTAQVWAADLVLTDRTDGKTPSVLAYNLGHFFPGSNAADWWRFSGATGARAFFSPSGFETKATPPPHDAKVSDLEDFLAARDALMADPLDELYINWTELRAFFSNVMPSMNRMTIDYALQNILPLSPDFLVQMNMLPGDFPIEGPEDWRGKWRFWRSYFSFAYYYASTYGMERFAMQNEPNHPHTFVVPEDWLVRAALAADAAEAAVSAANRTHDLDLRAKMYVPKLAGGILSIPGGAYARYGRPILQAWGRDFLGRETGRPLYYAYAQQPYDHAPDIFAHGVGLMKKHVAKDLAEGMPFPKIALTEFNVHTARNFDSMGETLDSPEKFTRLGMILGELMRAGLDEFYLFKFALTPSPSTGWTYPFKKNGMFHVDNDHEPHNYGNPTRAANVYRLFIRAFQPGRDQIQLTLTDAGALRAYASRDPLTGSMWIFAVNPGESQPLNVDLFPWTQSLVGTALVEEVGDENGGEVVAVAPLRRGRLEGLVIPPASVWLIHLPGALSSAEWMEIEVDADATVISGEHRERNFGDEPRVVAVNDPGDASGRKAAYFRFQLPDVDPERVFAAVVDFPVRRIGSGLAQAQVFLSTHSDWEESELSWSTSPDLRQHHPPGPRIVNQVVQGQGDTVFIAGQLHSRSDDFVTQTLDVSDLLRERMNRSISFLVAQEPRWDVNAAFMEMDGDLQTGGLEFASKEQTDVRPARIRLLVK